MGRWQWWIQTVQGLPLETYLIPTALIVLGFGFGGWAIYWDYRKKQLMYEERRVMIERGMNPPPVPEPHANTPAGAWAAKNRQQHEERRLMIEKGMTPPLPPTHGTWQKYLGIGLIAFFLGIGLGIAYLVLIRAGDVADAGPAGAWGAAIGMAGLGCTIYALILKRDRPEQPVAHDR
jgi:hypothetical protein